MRAPLPRDMRCSTRMHAMEEPKFSTHKWYLSCQEIEECSPSRKDGIDLEEETHLRKSYCSFLRKLGMKLDMPQVAIACGMMLCHRFYMRQSHAKNDWQTIATVSLFLAGKIMETPRFLRDVVTVAYEMIYDWDPFASHKIRQREVYNQQKELIVVGERLLLATIAYDLNIELPYKPLVAALKRLKIHPDLPQVAWNFVNDWLCTTLCLQHRPQYIAAGSLFLAAKFLKVKLQMEEGKAWWLEFDISPKQLEEVIQQMLRLLEQDRQQALSTNKRFTQAIASARKPIIIHTGSNTKWDSCNGVEIDELSKSPSSGGRHPSRKDALHSQTTDSGTSSAIEDFDGESQPRTEKSDKNPDYQIVSSQACGHREVRVKKVLRRQTSDGATSGSVEDSKGDSRLITGESVPDTGIKTLSEYHTSSIKTLSEYHTSSKIYASEIGETLKKRKEVSARAGNPTLAEARQSF